MTFRQEFRRQLKSPVFLIGFLALVIYWVYVFLNVGTGAVSVRDVYQSAFNALNAFALPVLPLTGVLAALSAAKNLRFKAPDAAPTPFSRTFWGNFWPSVLIGALLLMLLSLPVFAKSVSVTLARPGIVDELATQGLTASGAGGFLTLCYFWFYLLEELPLVFAYAVLGYFGGVVLRKGFIGAAVPIVYAVLSAVLVARLPVWVMMPGNAYGAFLRYIAEAGFSAKMKPLILVEELQSCGSIVVCVVFNVVLIAALAVLAFRISRKNHEAA